MYVQRPADGSGYGLSVRFENEKLARSSLGDGIQEASDFIVGLAVSGYQQINVIRILRKEDEISCYWIVRIIRKRQNDFAGKMLPLFVGMGLTVNVVKSSHHDVELEPPRKDSARIRKAGAAEVILASPYRFMLAA